MARKTSLREFQQNVAQRLRDLSARKTIASKLGFQVGEDNWLVNLADVSEVITVPQCALVPMTQSWFRGISNVRGRLYSVVDFSAFQGFVPIGTSEESRVVLINEKLIEGSGLIVNRMLGLRNADQLTVQPEMDSSRPWVKAILTDDGGMRWKELDLSVLTRQPKFLQVGS